MSVGELKRELSGLFVGDRSVVRVHAVGVGGRDRSSWVTFQKTPVQGYVTEYAGWR